MMNLIHAIFLGFVQGITEWLPLSSKSQIIVILTLMKIDIVSAISIALFLHIGTLLAAIIYLRKELMEIIHDTPNLVRCIAGIKKIDSKSEKLGIFLLVSTLVTGLLGVPLYIFFREAFKSANGEIILALIGVLLIITGLILYFSRKIAGTRHADSITIKDAVFVGILQGFSVLPGISRSGTSTAALLWKNFSQDDALRYSFLLSIPTVFAAEIVFGIIEGFGYIEPKIAIFLTLSSFVFGILSIDILLKVAKKINFYLFCILLGIVAILPLIFKVYVQ